VPLPPYEPDGSLPPIPVEEVTAKILVDRYGVSKQTLYTRLSAIGVTGTKRGKQVFFDQTEVYQLDAAHYFLSKGYGLKDLKDARLDVDVENLDQDKTIPSTPKPDPSVTELVIAPQQERVVMALTASIREALKTTHPPTPKDPLLAYRQLQEASEQKYQLTSQSLREIVGVAQSTVNSWSGTVSRNGFTLKRVGAGKWRVFREEDQMDQAA
tara:strand:- start:1174 stop:1809 length:636 start_codon:yes stop_codon:yes gene_type:complete